MLTKNYANNFCRMNISLLAHCQDSMYTRTFSKMIFRIANAQTDAPFRPSHFSPFSQSYKLCILFSAKHVALNFLFQFLSLAFVLFQRFFSQTDKDLEN